MSPLLEELSKHELSALLLLSFEKPTDLCRLLKTPFFDLEAIINNPVYLQYKIAKKKSGKREISAPDKTLKAIQKRINYLLQAYYVCIKPQEVHGFVINPGNVDPFCNIVNNAKVHTGRKFVLNIDLKDFFPGITARRVKEVFGSPMFNFNEQISTALTLLTTFDGRLPTGAPTSPVISNFVCQQLDKDLIGFSATHTRCYTRYADDLTFSSNETISDDLLLDIINLIIKNDFTINKKKLRIRSNNSKQSVTGITVNEKVNVDRKLLKKIRAMLHDLVTNGVDMATWKHLKIMPDKVDIKERGLFIHRLEGYINFVGQVRGKFDNMYLKFKSSFDTVFATAVPDESST